MKTFVALAVAISLLFVAARPSPARADSGATIAVLVIGAIAAWVGVVVIGTNLTTAARALQDVPQLDPNAAPRLPHNGIGVGARCRSSAAGVTLVCW